jgi:hypothetical protein
MSPAVRMRHLYITYGMRLRIFQPLDFCCTGCTYLVLIHALSSVIPCLILSYIMPIPQLYHALSSVIHAWSSVIPCLIFSYTYLILSYTCLVLIHTLSSVIPWLILSYTMPGSQLHHAWSSVIPRVILSYTMPGPHTCLVFSYTIPSS